MKLLSISQLHGMFPEDVQKDLKVTELGKLVEQHGTYRQVGKARVLTEDDIRHFFARIAVQQNAKPPEPADSESGLIVVVGDPAGTDGHMVLVDWAPRGHELILLDTVRDFCDENARVIDVEDITYGDFKKWREEMRKGDDWSHGKWFYRTTRVMKIFQDDEKGA